MAEFDVWSEGSIIVSTWKNNLSVNNYCVRLLACPLIGELTGFFYLHQTQILYFGCL